MFQKAKKFLKLFISLSLLLIVLFFGSLGFLAFGKVYLPEDSSLRQPVLAGYRWGRSVSDQAQLVVTRNPRIRAELFMSLSEIKLQELTVHGRGGTSTMERLTGEYIDQVFLAYKALGEIKDSREALASFSKAFKRLANHQLALQGIQLYWSREPLGAIERARDVNIRVQEQIAQRVTWFEEQLAPTPSVPSKSKDALRCQNCNVILISLTTLRKDHVGLYGYEKPTTPRTDSFFKDSLIFKNAFSPAAWTLPDAISLFTALTPYTHGVAKRVTPPASVVVNKSVLTLSQVLSANGYDTVAFTGGGDYNRRFNELDRGFGLYLDELTYQDFGVKGDLDLGVGYLRYAPLSNFIDHSIGWLDRNADKKFFFFIQGYDTHCPYTRREPYASLFTQGMYSSVDQSKCFWTYDDAVPVHKDGQVYWKVKTPITDRTFSELLLSPQDIEYMIGLYDARVAETDHELGKLFEKINALGLEKNTIIILMSEHGEMLGENGWFLRGGSVRGTSHDAALNFPLLIKHPDVKEPVVVTDIVQLVDLMPTILSMLDITDPQASLREGKALSLTSFGDTPTNTYGYAASLFLPSNENIYFGRPSSFAIIQDAQWKLVKETIFKESGLIPETITYKLFNKKTDPYEQQNIYGQAKQEAGDLKKKLESWFRQYTMYE